MNRFLSKLDLRDIKIDPRGSRFPPDADDAPAEDDEAAATPSLRQAQAEEAEDVVRGEDWEMGHDPTRTATAAYSPDDDDDDDAAPADDQDATSVGDEHEAAAGAAVTPAQDARHGESGSVPGTPGENEAVPGTPGENEAIPGTPGDHPAMSMTAFSSGSPAPAPPGPRHPGATPARDDDRSRPSEHWQRGDAATGDDRHDAATGGGHDDVARGDRHGSAPTGDRAGTPSLPGERPPGHTGDGGAETGEGGSYAPTADVLKVSARSRPSAVAGAIAGVVRELGRAEVQAIGAGATNQAIKAVAIARDYLQENGIEAVCIPAFIDVTIENEDRTAMLLVIEPR